VTDARDLDIVVHGATGFVGRLTAAYLAEHARDGVRIGLSGRSQGKLERVRADLGPRAADWPLTVADSHDAAALERLARSTTVIASTVGPYRRYGLPLVEACAAAGTHYADLTGEVLFIRESIDRAHEAAVASGARIVHCCGFDSIPSDLGTSLLHERVARDGAGELEDVQMTVMGMKGGASGGTIDSMRTQLAEIRSSKEQRKVVLDPYALSPDRSAEPDLGKEGDLMGVEHDDDLGVWLGPFVMAGINTRVVRRSNALQDWAYGRRFKYRETMAFGPGRAGQLKAAGFAAGVGGLVAGLSFPPARMVLDRVLPAPGEGPDEEARRNGFFKIEHHARTSTGKRYVAKVSAQGDPGYAATAVMLGESALALALDADALPERAGVLTPSTGIGTTLVDRLRAAGHTLNVRER
jgi:short subunit dehydrogenase-like uncharacterized protein